MTVAAGSLPGLSALPCGRISLFPPGDGAGGSWGHASTSCAGRSCPSAGNAWRISVSARHIPCPDTGRLTAGGGMSRIPSGKRLSAVTCVPGRDAGNMKTAGLKATGFQGPPWRAWSSTGAVIRSTVSSIPNTRKGPSAACSPPRQAMSFVPFPRCSGHPFLPHAASAGGPENAAGGRRPSTRNCSACGVKPG